LATGTVTINYGYSYYTKIAASDVFSQLNGGPLKTWIPELSLRGYLSPGDKMLMNLYGVNGTINPSLLLFNVSVRLVIAPGVQQTGGLLQSWNLTWGQWKSYPDQIFTVYFNASHYYEIQMSMYNNSSYPTSPFFHYTILYRDPVNVGTGEILLGLGVSLVALSLLPFVWAALRKNRDSRTPKNGSVC
jgi:hypothetical protein